MSKRNTKAAKERAEEMRERVRYLKQSGCDDVEIASLTGLAYKVARNISLQLESGQ